MTRNLESFLNEHNSPNYSSSHTPQDSNSTSPAPSSRNSFLSLLTPAHNPTEAPAPILNVSSTMSSPQNPHPDDTPPSSSHGVSQCRAPSERRRFSRSLSSTLLSDKNTTYYNSHSSRPVSAISGLSSSRPVDLLQMYQNQIERPEQLPHNPDNIPSIMIHRSTLDSTASRDPEYAETAAFVFPPPSPSVQIQTPPKPSSSSNVQVHCFEVDVDAEQGTSARGSQRCSTRMRRSGTSGSTNTLGVRMSRSRSRGMRQSHRRAFSSASVMSDPEEDPDSPSGSISHPDIPRAELLTLYRQISTQKTPVGPLTVFRYATAKDWIILCLAYGAQVVAGAALPLTNYFAGTVTNAFCQFLNNEIKADEYKATVRRVTLQYVYIGTSIGVFSYVSFYILLNRGEVLTSRIRKNFLRAVFQQNIAYFDYLGHSEIARRFHSDIQLIQEDISENSGLAVTNIAAFVSSTIIGFTASWSISITVVALLSSILIMYLIGMTYIRARENSINLELSEGRNVVSETITSIHTTTALGTSNFHAQRFYNHLMRASHPSESQIRFYAFIIGFMWFVIFSAYSLAFWKGFNEVENDNINVGDLLTAIISLMIAGFSLSSLFPVVHSFRVGNDAARNIFETIDRESLINPFSDSGEIINDFNGRIEFRNIRLRYPTSPSKIVLDDINLVINAGETVALVGPPGSGKSALLSLLERFYEPVCGSILIDDIDIKDINVHSLRQQIAIVTQEALLFSGTIYENIVQGLKGTRHENRDYKTKMEMVKRACCEVNAWGFILALDYGLDFQVGDRGCNLTTGQRQRIALARTVISQPRILLMDEALSALTERSEEFIAKWLARTSRQFTSLVVSSKLSTILRADRVVVILDGRVAEQGSHAELMANNQWYAKFVTNERLDEAYLNYRCNEPVLMFNRERQSAERSVTSSRSNASNLQYEIMHAQIPTLPSQKTLKNSVGGNSEKPYEESSADAREMSLISLVGMLIRINKEAHLDLFIGAMAATICGVSYPTISVFFARCMETIISPESDFIQTKRELKSYSGYVVILAGIQLFSYFLLFFFMGRAGDKLVRKLRYTIFRHVLRMDIEFFDSDRAGSESLTLMLLDEASRLKNITGQALGVIQDSSVAIYVCIFIVLAADWRLGLVATCLVPIMIASNYLRHHMYIKFQRKAKGAYESSASYASEMVTSVREVAALCREREVIEHYNTEINSKMHRHQGWSMLTAVLYAVSQGTTPLCLGLQVWHGSKLLVENKISIYQFYVSFISLVISAQAVQTIFSFGSETNLAQEATASISRLLQTIPEMDECSTEGLVITKAPEPGSRRTYGVSEDDVMRGEIEFRNVRFRYAFQPEYTVLQNINFKVEAEELVGIVGHEGSCDKPAILELIELFYVPQQGQIYMDGMDIKQLNLASYRQAIGYVNAQATFIDGLSVRENIMLGWGDEVLDECTLVRACKTAQIHDFIAGLPDGYNTSGGVVYRPSQKIRIALARAILREPTVLLVDDVLAPYGQTAVASDEVEAVRRAIESAARGRTTLVVASRTTMVAGADRVIVMEKGQVVEQGLRADLMARRGKFYELVQVQRRGV